MAYINKDTIDLRRYKAAVKRYKWLYIATFVVLMSGSIFFALTREPKYEVWTSILIENESSSGGLSSIMSQAARMFSMGGGGSFSVDDELLVMQSRTVLTGVVKDLGLNRQYYLKKGFMRKQTLYGNSPLLVVADEHYFDTAAVGFQFKVELKKNGKADVKAVQGFFTTLYEGTDLDLPATVTVDGAQFTLLPTDDYVKGEPLAMNIFLFNNQKVIEDLSEKIVIIDGGTGTNGIFVNYDSPSLQLSKDLLNMMVAKYNERRLESRQEKAAKGVEYIDRQLSIAYANLTDCESRMERFKAENNLTDMPAELQVLLESSSKITESMLDVQSQIAMCDLMLGFLKSEDSKYSLVPTTESGEAANEVVNQYNELVLQRIKLMRSAKPDNKALAEATEAIDAMRGVVVESVEQQKKNCNAALATLEGQVSRFTSRLDSAPKLEREYLDLYRESTMMNELYLFLLGKKADYQLTMASVDVPGTVIDKAYCKENEPSRLSSIVFPIIGLIFSLLLPTLFVLYRLYRHNVVNKGYDMPVAVKTSDDYTICEGTSALRPVILARGFHKIVPVLYDGACESAVAAPVSVLCDKLAAAGKKVLLIDLCNLYGDECQLGNLSQAEPVRVSSGIERASYDGEPCDLLLNDKFADWMQSREEKYDKVLIVASYRHEVFEALKNIADGGVSPVVYLAVSGSTLRSKVACVAAEMSGEKIIFGIV